jgi:hypothetical protein
MEEVPSYRGLLDLTDQGEYLGQVSFCTHKLKRNRGRWIQINEGR